jgi:arylsulfatase A-like enzyme
VLILIDTLRSDHLASYGYGIDTAPTIRRLAERGVLFERVIAQSSWTKTAMASIMTSRDPSGHGVLRHKDVVPRQLPTLAELLEVGGYDTIGLNTNPWLKAMFGFDAGFGVYETLHRGKEASPAWEVNYRALELLRERTRKNPVFLYLHYMDVHAPYGPQPYSFPGEAISVPEIGVVPDSQLELMYRKGGLEAPGVQERVIDLYDGGIRTVDEAIARLLEDLRKTDGFDDTVFVITSDHGESFREHGTTEHGQNLFPEVYDVPLVFFWPGILPAGTRIGAQVRSIDIVPTLLSWAGVAPPDELDGVPLLPMEPGAIRDRIAQSEVRFRRPKPPFHHAAVISREHLYVREKLSNVVEFYDLVSDPAALRDLGPSHPDATFYAELEGSSAAKTAEQTELDDQTRKELEALGYVQ